MLKSRWIQVGLLAAGALLILGHLIALVVVGASLSDWLGGTVVGLVLALLGGIHLVMARDKGEGAGSGRRRTAFSLVALAVGVGEGLLAALLGWRSWWLVLPWLLSALAIGMLMEGSRRDKALRLAAFGFSSVLIYATAATYAASVATVAIALVLAVAGGVAAVGVGALAHVVVSRVHT